jgi:hypothetical protein
VLAWEIISMAEDKKMPIRPVPMRDLFDARRECGGIADEAGDAIERTGPERNDHERLGRDREGGIKAACPAGVNPNRA